MKIFTGTSNPALALEVCQHLGIELGKIIVKTFSDRETRVEIEENVRDKDVFVVQSTCPPVNENLMQLLIIIDALKRAFVKRITAVIPYYGYGRQDQKAKSGVPISAKLVADLITVAGASRVISLDFHSGQIQGFFNIPVDNIFATPLFLKYIRADLGDNLVIVSPDAGGVERARAFAKRLRASLVIIDKRRDTPNIAEAMNIIGEVIGKSTIILDDMVDTAGTLVQAALALKSKGASDIYACCTHPVLSGPAIERIEKSSIKKLLVTNTIPLNKEAEKCEKITVLSAAELLGETIKKIFAANLASTPFV